MMITQSYSSGDHFMCENDSSGSEHYWAKTWSAEATADHNTASGGSKVQSLSFLKLFLLEFIQIQYLTICLKTGVWWRILLQWHEGGLDGYSPSCTLCSMLVLRLLGNRLHGRIKQANSFPPSLRLPLQSSVMKSTCTCWARGSLEW